MEKFYHGYAIIQAYINTQIDILKEVCGIMQDNIEWLDKRQENKLKAARAKAATLDFLNDAISEVSISIDDALESAKNVRNNEGKYKF